MDINDTKKQLKDRVALGLKYGLQAVEEVIADNAPVFNELINFKSQFNDLNSFVSKGLSDYGQIEIRSNQIRNGLLELIERLEGTDLMETDHIPEPINDDLQHRRVNFFQLLRLHENNLENLRLKEELLYGSATEVNIYTGRQALHKIYKDYFERTFKEKPEQDIIPFCHNFFDRDRYFMEVYFKTIGFIMAYIDENEIDWSFYFGILKSVLSRHELAFIFYFSISGINPKFKELVIKTGLIDEAVKPKLFTESHFGFLKP